MVSIYKIYSLNSECLSYSDGSTQKTFHFELVWRSIYRGRRAHSYECDCQDADWPQGVKPHAGLIRPLFDMQVNVREACGASLKNVARI